jgi:hypothetical protein
MFETYPYRLRSRITENYLMFGALPATPVIRGTVSHADPFAPGVMRFRSMSEALDAILTASEQQGHGALLAGFVEIVRLTWSERVVRDSIEVEVV